MDKRRCHAEFDIESCEMSRRVSCDGNVSLGHEHIEQEKRVRREIANSNERRRMQSINAGFNSLRILLPPVQVGEKLSKATILQLTAEYITNLHNRLNLLENEVAVYRQSTGIPPATVIPEFSTDFGMSRKRKPDLHKKRSSGVRSRRRRLGNETNQVPRSSLAGCSPSSTDIRQASPSNSFNSSISVSPSSPLPESTNSTSARLEHLVMAIEQIEGARALHLSDHESQDENLSAGDHSPLLSNETFWQSPPVGYHGCGYPEAQNTTLKPVTTFTDVIMLTPVTDVSTVTVPLNVVDSFNRSSVDYPVVTKLLNRPIPHKYLHRPQVVVNSTH